MPGASGRAAVNVGIIGAGPIWESRYRPALEALKKRLRVRAVHDWVAARAEQVAADLDAQPVQGIRSLIERPDIQAVLLLDPGWYGYEPLRLLATLRKPAFLAGSLGQNAELLCELHEQARADGLILMPEFSLRHTPATSRLQELMATRLGRPGDIRVEAVAPDPADADAVPGQSGDDLLIGLLDWIRYIAGRAPQSVSAERVASDEGEIHRILIEFRKPAGDVARSELRIRRRTECAPSGSTCGSASLWLQQEVNCERGVAEIRGSSQIAWANGNGRHEETLTSERSEIELLLDLFCRRVVGGLVPVADLRDVCRGLTLADAVARSRESGSPVSLPAEIG